MAELKLRQEELNLLKKRVIYLADRYEDFDQKRIKNNKAVSDFDISTPLGGKVYRGFSDEELLALIRRRALKLGHAPSQSEMFCVFKGYIKARFGKWPYALTLAGLPKSAGKGGITIDKKGQK